MKTELFKKMRAIHTANHKKHKQSLRDYIATRPAAEQKNFWNAPALPMSEIVKYRPFWVMMWHRQIKSKLAICAAIAAIILQLFVCLPIFVPFVAYTAAIITASVVAAFIMRLR